MKHTLKYVLQILSLLIQGFYLIKFLFYFIILFIS